MNMYQITKFESSAHSAHTRQVDAAGLQFGTLRTYTRQDDHRTLQLAIGHEASPKQRGLRVDFDAGGLYETAPFATGSYRKFHKTISDRSVKVAVFVDEFLP